MDFLKYHGIQIPFLANAAFSSVVRGAIAPRLPCTPKCKIRKKDTFLALFRLLYALEWTK